MTGGCDDMHGAGSDPKVPVQLVAHAEIPFGDAIMGKVTRAELAVRDALEPHYGPLKSRIYTLPRSERAAFVAGLPTDMPQGWTPVAENGFPTDKGLLYAYANGKRLFAILLVETGSAPDDLIPAVVFANFDVK